MTLEHANVQSLEQPVLLGDHSEMEPPDPLPNSEVKRLSANGSVGFPYARVGHRQASNKRQPRSLVWSGLFRVWDLKNRAQSSDRFACPSVAFGNLSGWR